MSDRPPPLRAAPPGAREPERHQFTVDAATGERLDLVLAERLGLSRTQCATLIANGNVLVNGRRERASYRARSGDAIEAVVPPPPGREVIGETIPLEIVHEDAHLLVVNKAPGMVVHPAPGNWTGTLVHALVGRGADVALDPGAGDERAGIVHRLDKDTSGLLLVAKSDIAHRALSRMIADRRVTRRYAALAWGHVADDSFTVDAPIARDPRDRKRMAVVSTGRSAKTDFRRLARFDSADLFRAQLHTGRTHQIRVHLAHAGHPVVGDDTYGGGGAGRLMAFPPHRHFLHAAWLQLRHPMTGAQLELRAPLPDDLHRSLVAAAGDEALAAHPDPLDFFGFFSPDS